MYEHINSWRDSSAAFEQQLGRNIQELKGEFPPHWIHFIDYVKNSPAQRVVDIGCGCGSYCNLSKQLGIDYIGYDYSQHAVDLATKTWNGTFVCKDYQELTSEDVKVGDLVVANALCDVLPSGDKCLRHLLKLGADYLLIQRVRITESPQYSRTYKAYDIMTYEFYHNSKQLAQDIKDHGYVVTYHKLYDDVFDLEIAKLDNI